MPWLIESIESGEMGPGGLLPPDPLRQLSDRRREQGESQGTDPTQQ